MILDLIVYLLFAIIVFNSLRQEQYILKSFALFVIINIILTFINIFFSVNNGFYYSMQTIILYYLFLCKITSNVKQDYINKKNVFIIFYKPKTLKQILLSMFGLSYSSAGILVFKDGKYYIYQMRYENKTLQKRELKNKQYLDKYLLIKTDIKSSQFNNQIENILLQQKARQKKTFYLRINCLRSLRFILNKSNTFNYNGEIFPSIYLLKLKLKGVI